MGYKKGPIRERVGGRVFGGFDDDDHEDDLELDYMSNSGDSSEEEDVM
jgi:hypothetical protein